MAGRRVRDGRSLLELRPRSRVVAAEFTFDVSHPIAVGLDELAHRRG